MDSVRYQIARRAAEAALALDSSVATQAASFIGLLAKWNKTRNLTALQLSPPSDEAIDRLLIEPMVAASLITLRARVAIDVGSGGGSPALPLKLARPELAMTLVESRSRKCAFLREAVRHLDLQHVIVEQGRFEDLVRRHGIQHSADVVTIRAVRADSALWADIDAVLRTDGQVLHFGGNSSREHLPRGFEVHSSRVLSTSGAVILDLRRRSR